MKELNLNDIKNIKNINDIIILVKKLIFSRFGKVFVAGGFGAVSQLLSYGVVFKIIIVNLNVFNLPESILISNRFPLYPKFFLAQLFAIEVGIFVTFFINNSWAFSDKKLKGMLFLRRFLKNHLVVVGAIVIQLVIGQILASIFGVGVIRDYVYQIVGILVGLFWNFYFYQRIIWKTK